MKIRGPIVTLARSPRSGSAYLLVNMSKEESAPPANPYAQSTTTAAAATPGGRAAAGARRRRRRFRRRPITSARSPPPTGAITLDITIEGNKAVAYACDGNSIESWLRGSAINGALSLASKDKTGRLEGKLEGNAVVGTLWIGEKKWDFKADPRNRLRVSTSTTTPGVRNSWIIDGNGGVTGVQRRPDGSTAPAPGVVDRQDRRHRRADDCRDARGRRQRCLIRPPRSE